MPHEKDRPCLSCALRGLVDLHGNIFGYTLPEMMDHMQDVLADMVAVGLKEGHEGPGILVIKESFTLKLADAMEREKLRRAEAASDKYPTVSDVGHA